MDCVSTYNFSSPKKSLIESSSINKYDITKTSPRLLAALMAVADLVEPRPAPRFPMVVVVAQSLLMLILV